MRICQRDHNKKTNNYSYDVSKSDGGWLLTIFFFEFQHIKIRINKIVNDPLFEIISTELNNIYIFRY